MESSTSTIYTTYEITLTAPKRTFQDKDFEYYIFIYMRRQTKIESRFSNCRCILGNEVAGVECERESQWRWWHGDIVYCWDRLVTYMECQEYICVTIHK